SALPPCSQFAHWTGSSGYYGIFASDIRDGTGVEGRVGLNHVIDEVARDAPEGPADCADDARCHSRFESVRAADGDDQLAHAELGGIAEGDGGQPGGIGLNDRQISPGIGADDPAAVLPSVAEPDSHPLLVAHDVMVGQQEPV